MKKNRDVHCAVNKERQKKKISLNFLCTIKKNKALRSFRLMLIGMPGIKKIREQKCDCKGIKGNITQRTILIKKTRIIKKIKISKKHKNN